MMVRTMLQKIADLIKFQWRTKFYLFLLAIVLWIFVVFSQVYETVLDVPVVSSHIKPQKVIVSDVPETASVRFSGKGGDLIILKYASTPEIVLDMSTINYFFDYPMKTSYLNIPPGLNVTPLAIISPETVKVVLEDELLVRLPVRPKATINTEPGYTLVGAIRGNPDTVTVSGPKSEVRKLRFVTNDTITFDKVKKDISEEVGVVIESAEHASAYPATFELKADIDRIGERKISRIPIGAIRVPRGRRVLTEPSSIRVVIRGPSRRLAGLTVDSISAYVNLNFKPPETKKIQPTVNLPSGIELVSIVPEEVQVRVEVSTP